MNLLRDLPFSAATERNKFAILPVLKAFLSGSRSVLEVGSGTGQHAVYFARELPYLLWQPSDLKENIETIDLRIKISPLDNLLPPFVLELGKDQMMRGSFDAIFTSNTFHILPDKLCEEFFYQSSQSLDSGAKVIIYGPFHYNGNATSETNTIFDRSLKRMGPEMGIKDMNQIMKWSKENSFSILDDQKMPVDNRILVFERQ